MKKFAVIGRKLPHTMSPFIYGQLGLSYEVAELESQELADFVRNGEYDGFNVTIPYKTEIIPYLDEVRGAAAEIGAVNTVVREGGKTVGYNTDVDGMAATFGEEGVSFRGKTVLILGTGGTSLTAAYLAEKSGAERVLKVSRTGEINYENCYGKAADAAIVINTTPVGMFPRNDECILDVARFKNAEFVFDAVYNPLRSRLVQNAADAGIKSRGGLSMLLGQAFAAYKLYTGAEVDSETRRRVSLKTAAMVSDLVLIGMPSCGKTTLGTAVAERLGKTFIDTDEEVLRLTGRTPAEIIKSDGEAAFRKTESDAVFEASKKTGAVIATGGGAVLSADNIRRLKANGFVVWVERDLSKLSAENRPLSQGADKIAELYAVRRPLYEKSADGTVYNDGDIEKTIRETVKLYEENLSY